MAQAKQYTSQVSPNRRTQMPRFSGSEAEGTTQAVIGFGSSLAKLGETIYLKNKQDEEQDYTASSNSTMRQTMDTQWSNYKILDVGQSPKGMSDRFWTKSHMFTVEENGIEVQKKFTYDEYVQYNMGLYETEEGKRAVELAGQIYKEGMIKDTRTWEIQQVAAKMEEKRDEFLSSASQEIIRNPTSDERWATIVEQVDRMILDWSNRAGWSTKVQIEQRDKILRSLAVSRVEELLKDDEVGVPLLRELLYKKKLPEWLSYLSESQRVAARAAVEEKVKAMDSLLVYKTGVAAESYITDVLHDNKVGDLEVMRDNVLANTCYEPPCNVELAKFDTKYNNAMGEKSLRNSIFGHDGSTNVVSIEGFENAYNKALWLMPYDYTTGAVNPDYCPTCWEDFVKTEEPISEDARQDITTRMMTSILAKKDEFNRNPLNYIINNLDVTEHADVKAAYTAALEGGDDASANWALYFDNIATVQSEVYGLSPSQIDLIPDQLIEDFVVQVQNADAKKITDVFAGLQEMFGELNSENWYRIKEEFISKSSEFLSNKIQIGMLTFDNPALKPILHSYLQMSSTDISTYYTGEVPLTDWQVLVDANMEDYSLSFDPGNNAKNIADLKKAIMDMAMIYAGPNDDITPQDAVDFVYNELIGHNAMFMDGLMIPLIHDNKRLEQTEVDLITNFLEETNDFEQFHLNFPGIAVPEIVLPDELKLAKEHPSAEYINKMTIAQAEYIAENDFGHWVNIDNNTYGYVIDAIDGGTIPLVDANDDMFELTLSEIIANPQLIEPERGEPLEINVIPLVDRGTTEKVEITYNELRDLNLSGDWGPGENKWKLTYSDIQRRLRIWNKLILKAQMAGVDPMEASEIPYETLVEKYGE